MRMISGLLLTLSCEGCLRGCFDPSLPRPSDNTNTNDTGGTEDSGVDSADTGTKTTKTLPDPRCPESEVESNDWPLDEPNVIPVGSWFCGDINEADDLEYLEFTIFEGAWLRLEISAAGEGSAANLSITLPSDDNGDMSGVLSGSHRLNPWGKDLNDPMMFIPIIDPPVTLRAVLGDESWLPGSEDYHWRFRALVDKAPVEWDIDEVEPNDTVDEPMEIETELRVFGSLDGTFDYDFYQFEVPTFAKGQSVTIQVDIDGSQYGSPVRSQVQLLHPTGVDQWGSWRDGDADNGGVEGDALQREVLTDPADAGLWMVKVRRNTDDSATTSAIAWYVLDLSLTIEE